MELLCLGVGMVIALGLIVRCAYQNNTFFDRL